MVILRAAMAVMAVANVVKTSLGPVGLDKARRVDSRRARGDERVEGSE